MGSTPERGSRAVVAEWESRGQRILSGDAWDALIPKYQVGLRR